MSIQSLNIEGYRSLRAVRWRPGALNVVIGPNGSGKSNLLRALDLFRHSADGDLADVIQKQGGMNAIRWDGRADALLLSFLSAEEAYALELKPVGISSTYRIELENVIADGQPRLSRNDREATFTERTSGLWVDARDNLPEELPLLSQVGYLGSDPLQRVRARLQSWGVYHDIRVDQAAPLRQAAVARMEKRVAADGQNLIPVLHTLYTSNRDFKRTVDAAMRAAFGPEFEELVFPPAADQRIQLRIRWRSLQREQSAADLSDGTLRFLLLLAMLANPAPGALIAIDEPEAGLHPSMLPLIAELAAEAAERTQVIFTTHSPQFLDAFRDVIPTTTVTQSIEGETRLTVLDGEELALWLKQYSLGTLFRSGELEGMA